MRSNRSTISCTAASAVCASAGRTTATGCTIASTAASACASTGSTGGRAIRPIPAPEAPGPAVWPLTAPISSTPRTTTISVLVRKIFRPPAYCVHTVKSWPQTLPFVRIMSSTAWIG